MQTTEEQIKSVFGACGAIKDVVVVPRKGFSFIEYEAVEVRLFQPSRNSIFIVYQ